MTESKLIHVESKRFTFSRVPRGEDLAFLVSENNLQGWQVDIKKRALPIRGGSVTYVYDVIFERNTE